jgi:hypothetical protein
MDQECQDRIATCLAHAVVGFSRVLERAIIEAEVEPPPVETTLLGFAVTAASPARAIAHHCRDLNDRMKIQAAFDEVQRLGKIITNLPDDDREIRRLHAEEVLKTPLHKLDHTPAGLTGTLYGSGAIERFRPQRLISIPVFPREKPISRAWRNAQDKVRAAISRVVPVQRVAA